MRFKWGQNWKNMNHNNKNDSASYYYESIGKLTDQVYLKP